MHRHCVLALCLGLVGCDCSDMPVMMDPIDASLLIGEGQFPLDLGRDAEADSGIEVGVDAESPLDAEGPDAEPPPDDQGVVDAGDPCTPDGLVQVSAEAVANGAMMLDGQILRMSGTASVGEVLCTLRPCPDGTTCCNTCRADLWVEGVRLAPSECTLTSTIGCRGTPCEPLVCSPPLVVDIPSAYDGRVRASSPPSLELFRTVAP